MSDHKITTEQIRGYHRLANSTVLRARLQADFPSAFTPTKKPLCELPVGTIIRISHAGTSETLRVGETRQTVPLFHPISNKYWGCLTVKFTDYQIVKPPPAEQWEVVEDE